MRSSLALLFVSGCALSQGAFGHRFPDNRSSDLDAVVGRLEAAPVPSHHAVLVGVASDPVGLYAYDLDANRLAFRRDGMGQFYECSLADHFASHLLIPDQWLLNQSSPAAPAIAKRCSVSRACAALRLKSR